MALRGAGESLNIAQRIVSQTDAMDNFRCETLRNFLVTPNGGARV